MLGFPGMALIRLSYGRDSYSADIESALVIFSFIPDDIRRCQMVKFFAAKPYLDFKGGRLTLENVPVPPPSPVKKSELLIALEHSRLVHTIMKRLFPRWWLDSSIQVQDENVGKKAACALL